MASPPTVALLGGTGKVGGWVLEMALERNYKVKAMCRKPEKLDAYKDKIETVAGKLKHTYRIASTKSSYSTEQAPASSKYFFQNCLFN